MGGVCLGEVVAMKELNVLITIDSINMVLYCRPVSTTYSRLNYFTFPTCLYSPCMYMATSSEALLL